MPNLLFLKKGIILLHLIDISIIFISITWYVKLFLEKRMEKIEEILFYKLEKAIKTYRQYAQRQIKNAGFDITIDQWLVLKTIKESSNLSQQQIAQNVFKDYASVTRIIELLVKKEYLMRSFHNKDRRRFELSLTELGETIIDNVYPIVLQNRNQALKSISKKDIEALTNNLNEIISNCQ